MAWLVDGGSGRCCGGLNGGERDLVSMAFLFGLFLCFRVQFLCFRFSSSIPFSLSRACSSLSPLSPVFSLEYFSASFLSPLVSSFIAKNGAGKLLLMRLQSRPAGRLFRWWWGRGERGGKVLKMVFFFCCRFGGKGRRGTVPFKTAPFGLSFFLFVFGLVPVFPSLSLVRALSSPLSLLRYFPFNSPLSLSFGLPIYRKTKRSRYAFC